MTFGPYILVLFPIALLILGAYNCMPKIPKKTDSISDLCDLIKDGLQPFSKRIINSISQSIVYMTLALIISNLIFDIPIPWHQIFSFCLGGSLFCLLSFLGLKYMPYYSQVVTHSAHGYLTDAFKSLLKHSAGASFVISGLILFTLFLCTFLLGKASIIGFTLGVILPTFILRLGGALYKTSTDIGSDISGQIEKELPAFDARNPATLLDICGDYIGNLLGFCSDLFSTYLFAIMGILLIPLALEKHPDISQTLLKHLWHLPLELVCLSIFSTIAGFIFCRIRIKYSQSNTLLETVYVTLLCCAVGGFFIISTRPIDNISLFLDDTPLFFSPYLAYVIGLLSALIIGFLGNFLTSKRFSPLQSIVSKTQYGPVITLINISSGSFKGSSFFILIFIATTLCAYLSAGLFGLPMAALGMLSTTPILLMLCFFKTLSSNSYKLSLLSKDTSQTTKNLHKLSQFSIDTSALGNGFGSFVTMFTVISFLLGLFLLTEKSNASFIMNVIDFAGILLGLALMAYVFSSLLHSLYNAIIFILQEVTRQFKEIPYLIENKSRPDIANASNKLSIKIMGALLMPSILIVLLPLILGFLFQRHLIIGVVIGAFLVCLLLSLYFSHFGDISKQVKNHIEQGNFGGKESPNFETAILSDNVGDAFKDLLSPSCTVILKMLSLIAALILYLVP